MHVYVVDALSPLRPVVDHYAEAVIQALHEFAAKAHVCVPWGDQEDLPGAVGSDSEYFNRDGLTAHACHEQIVYRNEAIL